MSRLLESVLAAIGAADSIISALFVWNSGPDARQWPFPVLALAEWVTFGLAGLVGIALSIALNDNEGRSSRWGLLTWISAGGLLGSAVIGLFEIGLFVFPAMLAFGSAAVLVDRRRRPSTKVHLAAAITMAAATAVVNLLAISR